MCGIYAGGALARCDQSITEGVAIEETMETFSRETSLLTRELETGVIASFLNIFALELSAFRFVLALAMAAVEFFMDEIMARIQSWSRESPELFFGLLSSFADKLSANTGIAITNVPIATIVTVVNKYFLIT